MRQGTNSRFEEHPKEDHAHEHSTSTAVLGPCSVVGRMRGSRSPWPRWSDLWSRWRKRRRRIGGVKQRFFDACAYGYIEQQRVKREFE